MSHYYLRFIQFSAYICPEQIWNAGEMKTFKLFLTRLYNWDNKTEHLKHITYKSATESKFVFWRKNLFLKKYLMFQNKFQLSSERTSATLSVDIQFQIWTEMTSCPARLLSSNRQNWTLIQLKLGETVHLVILLSSGCPRFQVPRLLICWVFRSVRP